MLPIVPPAVPVSMVAVAPALAPAILRVTDLGAVGDGRTDDTVALQRALDAAPPRSTVVIPGGSFVHSDVLHLRNAGVRVVGPGTLVATDEARSSVWVEAPDVTVEGLTLRASATRRWDAFEQMGLRLAGTTGTTVRDVTVQGAAAAGVYVGGASQFTLVRVAVIASQADGVHITGGSHDGLVDSPSITESGDDGVAVVSYRSDAAPVRRVTIDAPRVLGTRWGRGISVVGGEGITYRNVHVERSDAAAVYVGSEGAPYCTRAARDVQVLGGQVEQANVDPAVDHGAVLVVSDGAGEPPSDITIADLLVRGTRSTASRSVGLVGAADPPSGVVLRGLHISGGPASAFSATVPDASYATEGWTVDGHAVADHVTSDLVG